MSVTEDAASRRAARPGGSRLHCETGSKRHTSPVRGTESPTTTTSAAERVPSSGATVPARLPPTALWLAAAAVLVLLAFRSRLGLGGSELDGLFDLGLHSGT